MPIAISCPHCDWKGRVKDELAGKTGKCPTCGEKIPIPRQAARAVDEDPDVIDDADVVEEAPRPKAKAESRRRDVEDDRPRRRRSEDEDDDRPSRSRRRPPADEDEDDDRPRLRRRSRADDDDEEDRPRARRRGPAPSVRRRERTGRRESGRSFDGQRLGEIIGSFILLAIGVGLLAMFFMCGGRLIWWSIVIIIIAIIGILRTLTGEYD
jgi:hypothetical protein